MQSILICLSSHGFGHLGQVTPVVRELLARLPQVEIVIRSNLPEFKLREKLGEEIRIIKANSDIGMIQKNALTIDLEETRETYRRFHQDWDKLLASEKSAIEELNPDLALVNIPYLSLAALHELNIPSIAFCSLNWAEIYQYFFRSLDETQAFVQQMLNAYNGANAFLQPAPAMKMPGITNAIPIAPVAQIGTCVREELNRQIGLKAGEKIVLVSLGGMDLKTACDSWPRFSRMRFLVPESWNSSHPDTIPLESLGHPFSDLMASADLLVCKPGYGSFVEAACNKVPVLYMPRERWPESDILIEWFRYYQPAGELSALQFEQGRFQELAEHVLAGRRSTTLVPAGASTVVDTICSLPGCG